MADFSMTQMIATQCTLRHLDVRAWARIGISLTA
jgi:hypothetical protein